MTFRIGMKLDQVLKQVQAGSTGANNKTTELIFNFCKNDSDGKISNGNELAMLNAWASGSEKVAMPKPEGLEANVDGHSVHFIRDKENNLDTTYEPGVVTTGPASGPNRYLTDMLIDNDGDGFADTRLIHNGSALAGKQELIMEDSNLNGIPDNQE